MLNLIQILINNLHKIIESFHLKLHVIIYLAALNPYLRIKLIFSFQAYISRY